MFPHTWTSVVREFVYYDGLPQSGYYSHVNTKDKFLGGLERGLRKWCPARIESVDELVLDKYVRFTLEDGRILHYFINTLNDEVAAWRSLPAASPLRQLLARVTCAFVAGHTPHAGVWESLAPQLTAVFCEERMWMFQDTEAALAAVKAKCVPYEPFAVDYDSDASDENAWLRKPCDKCDAGGSENDSDVDSS